MDLEPKQKVFWYYVNDRCNNIGVWTPNLRLAAFNCGINGDVRDFADRFLVAVNVDHERIKILDDGSWFLTGFASFQYGKLNPANRAHMSYIKLMQNHGLTEFFRENYPELLPENLELSDSSFRTLKELNEKRIEKEKETDKEKEQETEKDTPPTNSASGKKKDSLPPVTGKAKSAETADMKFPGRRDVPDFVFEADIKKIKDEIGENKLAELFQNVKRTENWSDFAETYLPEGAQF